jgi:RimJ/RimL family protein N-acetyltransferase
MIKVDDQIYLDVIDRSSVVKIYEWKNDLELSSLTNASPIPVTLQEVETWIEKTNSDKNQLVMGIFYFEKELIGIVRLMYIDWINRSTELGIYIAQKNFRGRGIGKKVTKSILNYAFSYLNLNKVYLKVAENNLPAYKCYESVGFIKCGVLKNHFWIHNNYVNAVIMEIFRTEFTN